VIVTPSAKLESNSADYPPSEKVIELLATHLELNIDRLRRLAGRLNAEEEQIFQELYHQYPQMPKLLRRMANDPTFAKRIIDLANGDE
jgi:HTH-type transcriptional regulator, competence development regulator